MKPTLVIALLAGATLAAATQTAIAAPASGIDNASRVTDMSFAVYDLMPGDGVAAGYTIATISTRYELTYNYTGAVIQHVETLTAPGTVTQASGPTFAQGTWQGIPGELTMLARIEAPEAATFVAVAAEASQTIVMTLAPHTTFVASGRLILEGSVYGTWSYAEGNDGMTIRIGTADGTTRDFIRFDTYVDDIEDGPIYRSNIFAVGFTNATDVARDITLSLDLFANSVITVPAPLLPAVPEPSTWTMLGAGLLTVGASLRKRAASRRA